MHATIYNIFEQVCVCVSGLMKKTMPLCNQCRTWQSQGKGVANLNQIKLHKLMFGVNKLSIKNKKNQ